MDISRISLRAMYSSGRKWFHGKYSNRLNSIQATPVSAAMYVSLSLLPTGIER